MNTLNFSKDRFGTGITTSLVVKGHYEGCIVQLDIAYLDEPSLLAWLKEGGGDNPRAENVVGVMLGFGRLHPIPNEKPDRFAWNKPGPKREAIEAFLREAEGWIDRTGDSLLMSHSQAVNVVAVLRSLLDWTPSKFVKDGYR